MSQTPETAADPNLDRLRAYWPQARRDDEGDIHYSSESDLAVAVLLDGDTYEALRPYAAADDNNYTISDSCAFESEAVEAILRAAEAEGWLPAPSAPAPSAPAPSAPAPSAPAPSAPAPAREWSFQFPPEAARLAVYPTLAALTAGNELGARNAFFLLLVITLWSEDYNEAEGDTGGADTWGRVGGLVGLLAAWVWEGL